MRSQKSELSQACNANQPEIQPTKSESQDHAVSPFTHHSHDYFCPNHFLEILQSSHTENTRSLPKTHLLVSWNFPNVFFFAKIPSCSVQKGSPTGNDPEAHGSWPACLVSGHHGDTSLLLFWDWCQGKRRRVRALSAEQTHEDTFRDDEYSKVSTKGGWRDVGWLQVVLFLTGECKKYIGCPDFWSSFVSEQQALCDSEENLRFYFLFSLFSRETEETCTFLRGFRWNLTILQMR